MRIYIVMIYIAVINLVGFCLMGMDKRRAQKHRWRIQERTLFLAAALGGSPGAILGMYTFRHKTKKKIFVFGMPMILILQILAGIYIAEKTGFNPFCTGGIRQIWR